MKLSELLIWLTWGGAKQPVKFHVGHLLTDAVIEIFQVQTKRAILLDVNQVSANYIREFGLPVRS